jgi:DNA polymerase iota
MLMRLLSPQDCFYASVFEHENPALRSLPLAVQQKQIVVTCNYEARRRGLHKLQLIHEAKKVCPDVVIVLGEDLTRFRNASKELYAFLRSFSWNSRCERLGFDEVCLFQLCLSTASPFLRGKVGHQPPKLP